MVMPGEACTYRIAVAVDHAEVPPAGGDAPPEPCFDTIEDARSGWYLGDLQAHSVHFDGAWEVADLVAAARTRGLDFVTLTDHNTTGGLAEMARCGGRGLLTMGGQELTTYWGHALCLGSRSWHDWRGLTREGSEMAALADATYAEAGLYVIAHPRTAGDPHCTGCRWVDSSKFGQTAPVLLGRLPEVHLLVTDRIPDPQIAEMCSREGIRFLETDGDMKPRRPR